MTLKKIICNRMFQKELWHSCLTDKEVNSFILSDTELLFDIDSFLQLHPGKIPHFLYVNRKWMLSSECEMSEEEKYLVRCLEYCIKAENQIDKIKWMYAGFGALDFQIVLNHKKDVDLTNLFMSYKPFFDKIIYG